MKIVPTVRVSDMKRSLQFYCDLLGFRQAGGDIAFGYVGLEQQGERLDLSVHSGDGQFGNCVYIEVEDVDEVYQQILEKGHDVTGFSGVERRPLDQTWGMREFYISDPDGNSIRYGSYIRE